jgi:hypothetical protein
MEANLETKRQSVFVGLVSRWSLDRVGVRSCSLESGQILSSSPVWRLSSSVNVSGQQSNPSPEGVREARKWKQIFGTELQLVCSGG